MNDANIVGAILERANLKRATLSNSKIGVHSGRGRKTIFTNAILTGATFIGCAFVCSNDIIRSISEEDRCDTLNEATLLGANFSNTLLGTVNFEEKDLRGCNFSGAYLEDACFGRANLRGAKFIGADLTNAQFNNATLDFADFRGASLTNVKWPSTQ